MKWESASVLHQGGPYEKRCIQVCSVLRPPFSPDELASKIVEKLLNYELREKLIQVQSEFVQDFGWDHLFEPLMRFLLARDSYARLRVVNESRLEG
jgi:hypothetical protein